MLNKLLLLALSILIGFMIISQVPVWAVDLNHGEEIFSIHCAGCHPNGSNIIRRGKNLKLKALQKNKVDSLEAIAALVTNGKNNMSAYSDRLTPEEIQAVSVYVLEQAQNNWTK
ncbi:cytochrome c class I [Rippkaea orientalis PCC 8801]|uniref:Cytochrome c class I n=1 Tax=Rippkaea orientalis (strain PCC 8801 / RF-1) TaxID=41431 RepID=B7K485_RIPO1|nr:c-type cytochrome [Rippkaea orientalis]ACK67791.1 cytochrome c class I [Rippkaea orientalis PCC 8801]